MRFATHLRAQNYQCCGTTSAISVEIGEPPSHCDLVFQLFRSHCISFHASVLARVTALPWLRLWQSNALHVQSVWMPFGAPSLMQQRQRQQCAFTRSQRLEVFSDSHKHGENKTTHRSLIVPNLTSSFNWEETGPRSCNVIDSTPFALGRR